MNLNPIFVYVFLKITEAVLEEVDLTASAELCSRFTFWVGVLAIVWCVFIVLAVLAGSKSK